MNPTDKVNIPGYFHHENDDLDLKITPLSDTDLMNIRFSTVGDIDKSNLFIHNKRISDFSYIVSSTDPNLKHITISKSIIFALRDLDMIKNLKMIKFRDCVFHMDTFGQTFSLLPKLKSVQFINCEMNDFTSLSYIFHYCSKLESVRFSKCSTKSLREMNYTFRGCFHLQSDHSVINIDTENIGSMRGMFYNCSSLTSLSLCESFKTDNLQFLSEFCYGCSSLSNIDALIDWDVSNVKKMDSAFALCDSLNGLLALYLWDTKSLQNLKSFLQGSGVYNLAGIRDFNVVNVREIETAFAGTRLTTTYGLEKWCFPRVTDISYMFYSCKHLKDLKGLRTWDLSNVIYLFQTFAHSGITNVEALRNWRTNKVIDMRFLFSYCLYLENIKGLKHWDVRNVKDMDSMFEYTGINNTDALRLWRTNNLNTTKRMFFCCDNLASIEGISFFDMRRVVNISHMFTGCISLTDVNELQRWKFENLLYAWGTFKYCTNLVSIAGLSRCYFATVISFSEFLAYTSVRDIRMLTQQFNEDADVSHFVRDCPLVHNIAETSIYRQVCDPSRRHML